MNDYNEKKEKKAGVGGLFGSGGSSVVGGGASSGLGSGGGLAGLFASKAGILGMVLGGATLAAGVGVVYNFVGPSSKPVYNPDLFQNTYIEEEASRASVERAQSRDASAAASSTLDMFKEQAKKDGLGLGGEGGEGSGSAEAGDPANSSADASAEAPSAPGGDAAMGGAAAGGPKLQANAGFGSKGGGAGGGSSMPKLQGGAGLAGGIGAQFQPVYRAPAQANAGKTSAMTASAARVKSSPKYAVPNVNKKGAYGQAKFAGKMGAKAAYSADGAGARTSATEAFTGETSGGDSGSPAAGAGLGGAGVSNGAGLKGNDPSLSSNEYTPPKVPKPEDVDPWQAEEDKAMNGMMWALGAILLAKLFSKIGNMCGPWGKVIFAALAAAAAIFAIIKAITVIMAGFAMYSKFDQKMMGGIYILTGVMLMLEAIKALGGACSDAGGAGSTTTTTAASGTTPATSVTTPGVLGSAGGTLSSIGSGLSSVGGIMSGI
ncbi:MAG: hypothetical protein A2X32_11965 [Elusimicrobia bacterium GWC2_64_44]|nr:MAG: hypothetical protein A2X32_11965 [Elusimicrobia bacterium GWC2_64_44]